MEILTSYSFLVVALGTFFLAAAAGAIGCLNVLQGQSLIGDAIGHATFPGIVLAFMLTLERTPFYLFLGAFFMGAVAFACIQLGTRYSKLSLDVVLAVVLSTAFGLGMVLKSYIQGHPGYAGGSQSGLSTYLFGQAAYMTESDGVLIVAAASLSIGILVLFYKEFQVFLFDKAYAQTIGVSYRLLQGALLVCTLVLIATGLKVVGAILIASLLVMPAIAAMQWSHRWGTVLRLAAMIGGLCAIVGTYLSSSITGLSTGPTIIVCLSVVAGFSLSLGPHGVLANWFWQRREVKS